MSSDSQPPLDADPTVQGGLFVEDTPNTNLEELSVVVSSAARAVRMTPEGEVFETSPNDAAKLLKESPCLVCHAAFTARRLHVSAPQRRQSLFDVLELFAFVHPATFCLPTPTGLAAALNMTRPVQLEDEALIVFEAVSKLLDELSQRNPETIHREQALARAMGRAGWPWAQMVLEALPANPNERPSGIGFDVWNALKEWEDFAPLPAPEAQEVNEEEARTRLRDLLIVDQGTRTPEERPTQQDYTGVISKAFAPRSKKNEPNIVLAEAGTGIGKTLGYISPASIWAEKNGPGTWISTYTKNLQRQIDQELNALFPDPKVKAQKAVIRKGRENYLCLLNFQETLARRDPVEMGLIARWIQATRDGDMVGGDFPSWLGLLFPRQSLGQAVASSGMISLGLTDRRSECIYAACTHYRKCFIEKATRRAKRADIVVANHALVMMHAALDQMYEKLEPASDESKSEYIHTGPTRYVFDEGHHIFDAADSAFSSHLSGLECAELRRWIRGPEDRRQRGRGLRDRLNDLIDDSPEAEEALMATLKAASALPASGWTARILEGQPQGPAESFLALVHQQVEARDTSGSTYSQETSPWPPLPDLLEEAKRLHKALEYISRPLRELARLLRRQLDDEARILESSTRARIEALARGLERRGSLNIPAWQNMLGTLQSDPEEGFVDWFNIERAYGRLFDVGMHRHWIDPTIPFSQTVMEPAHGVVVTSATLRDHVIETTTEDETTWQNAEMRTGASHLTLPPIRRSFSSPFDYADQTRVFVVTDVPRDDTNAVASAYRELFLASGGGALGLFTAIHRLRKTYDAISPGLDKAGLPLYAQHVDAMDTATLVDIFRSELNSCLLGTDAVRDGVDVPGQSLRLIVFDRVPWPRPDILHRARRDHFGKKNYDDMITRLRLKQAFGRLIRRSNDRGVFVMLDSRAPSRLMKALPEGPEIVRLGLADTIKSVKDFLYN